MKKADKKAAGQKVMNEVRKQKAKYDYTTWEVEAKKTTAAQSIAEGRIFDKKLEDLRFENSQIDDNYSYPVEIENPSLPTGLYVKNKKDYNEMVGNEGVQDDRKFYEDLLKKDPEAADFYMKMHVDSYSNQPLTQWGKDRRATRTKDIVNDGIKTSDFIANDEGKETHILDTEKAVNCSPYKAAANRKQAQNYTENDYRPNTDSPEESIVGLIALAQLAKSLDK